MRRVYVPLDFDDLASKGRAAAIDPESRPFLLGSTSNRASPSITADLWRG
jgi:hypothetical protein